MKLSPQYLLGSKQKRTEVEKLEMKINDVERREQNLYRELNDGYNRGLLVFQTSAERADRALKLMGSPGVPDYKTGYRIPVGGDGFPLHLREDELYAYKNSGKESPGRLCSEAGSR